MTEENTHKYIVIDDRNTVYGKFQTENGAKVYVSKVLASSHNYDITDVYYIHEIANTTTIETRG